MVFETLTMFGHRSGFKRSKNQTKKVGCRATYLFGLVLAPVGAASMPKPVDVWTSLDAKTIE